MATDIFGNTLNPNFIMPQQAPQVQTPVAQSKPQNKKSWLSLVPSGLAALASFIPGVGTAASTVLGGAGEFAREKLSGEKTSWGSIGREAALSAIPGGIGKLGEIAKGGEIAIKGAEVAGEGAKVAEQGANAASAARSSGILDKVLGKGTQTPSSTSKIGSSIRGGNRNIEVGSVVPQSGSKLGLTEQRANDLNQTVNNANKGILPRSLQGQLNRVQQAKSTAATAIDQAVNKANKALAPEELTKIHDSAAKVIVGENGTGITGITGAHQVQADEFNKLLSGVKDTKGLNNFVKNMDTKINYARNVNSPDPVLEQIATAYRQAADKKLTAISGDIKAAKTQYSKLSDAEKLMTKGATSDTNAIPIKGIKSGLVSKVIQSGKEATGKVLQTVGSEKAIPTYGRALTAQGIAHGVGDSVLGANQDQQLPQDQTQLDENGQPITDGTNPSPSTITSSTVSESDQLQTGLRQAALKALASGDTKGLANIKAISDMLTAQDKANPSANLTKSQQTTVDNANTASSTLDTMLQQLGSIGGGAGRIGGLVGSVEGKLGLNNKVSAFNSTKTDAAIVLAQALSGSTRVPPPSTLKLLENSMPNYTDNPEEAQRKVDILKQRLASKLNAIPGAALQ